LSGCYIGNKEVDAPFNGPWFYETQLSNIQVCAAVNGQAADCKSTILTSYLPQFYIPLAQSFNLDFSSWLTDPVLVSQINPTAGATVGANYVISNSDGSGGFVVNANGIPASPISYSASSQVELFHDVKTNPATSTCLMDTTVQINGNLTNAGPFTSYSSDPLTGRIVYTVNITMTPDPVINTGCAQAIRCYNDPVNQCEGVAVEEVEAIFQDFTLTGALDLSTNPTVNSLSYTIQYQ
jgi:hypothetical protein